MRALQEMLVNTLAEAGLSRQDSLIVAVSGGPDSLLLLELLTLSGFRPLVAHFDHGLRPDSTADAVFVRQAAAEKGLAFELGAADVAMLAAAKGWSIEQAAREVRYRFFFDLADQHGAKAVLTGHNADDQVETIVMNTINGSGMAGLRGMQPISLPNPWSERIALVRPMLGLWRSQIDAACVELHLVPRIDQTNQAMRFMRNRIRLEVLPLLEQVNPQAKQHLWQLSKTIEEDWGIVEAVLDDAEQYVQTKHHPNEWIGFDHRRWIDVQPSLKTRLLRRWLVKLVPGERLVTYERLQSVVSSLDQKSAGREYELGGGWSVVDEGWVCWLARSADDLPSYFWPQITHDQISALLPGSTIGLANGWILTCGVFDQEMPVHTHRLVAEGIVPHDMAELGVRAVQAADQRPNTGQSGRQASLMRWLMKRGIPRRIRECWPVVLSDGQAVWTPGMKSKTGTHGLHLRLYAPTVIDANWIELAWANLAR